MSSTFNKNIKKIYKEAKMVSNHIVRTINNSESKDWKPLEDIFYLKVPKLNIEIYAVGIDYGSEPYVDIESNVYIPLLNKSKSIEKFLSSFKKFNREYPTVMLHESVHIIQGDKEEYEYPEEEIPCDIVNSSYHETQAIMVELIDMNMTPNDLYDEQFITDFVDCVNKKYNN